MLSREPDLIRATLHSDISNHPQYQRFSSQYENATLHCTSINKNAFCKLSRKYSNQNTFVAEKKSSFCRAVRYLPHAEVSSAMNPCYYC